jgi:hypothetical protein
LGAKYPSSSAYALWHITNSAAIHIHRFVIDFSLSLMPAPVPVIGFSPCKKAGPGPIHSEHPGKGLDILAGWHTLSWSGDW